MTKADIVTNISDKLGIDKVDVQATIENFMTEVKQSLENGENVYLRSFGSFIIKTYQKIQQLKYLPTTFQRSSQQRFLRIVLKPRLLYHN